MRWRTIRQDLTEPKHKDVIQQIDTAVKELRTTMADLREMVHDLKEDTPPYGSK